MSHWHSITNPDRFNETEITCKACVYPGSPWFSGHFPGDPILPGIAQLAMIFDVIKQVHKDCRKISEIRRVRFKQVIGPDDMMDIIITSRAEGPCHYSFRIMLKGDLACSGTMIVERSE
jgi:3-hydroxyacyl-[acyl-carrier-protein] dehydratase